MGVPHLAFSSTALPLNPASLLIKSPRLHKLCFPYHVSQIPYGHLSMPDFSGGRNRLVPHAQLRAWQNPCCLDGSGRKRPEEYERQVDSLRMQPASELQISSVPCWCVPETDNHRRRSNRAASDVELRLVRKRGEGPPTWGTVPGLARLRPIVGASSRRRPRRLPVAAAWHCIGRSGIQSHH